ncbi:signal recognition particle-docking protein FtsY [Xanthobacter albus]|uniref:signal recognition particle-docking protein FtsY n=1 Tax=Xanthobacter albus TaxID=3119929 RepID=UPI00372D3B18
MSQEAPPLDPNDPNAAASAQAPAPDAPKKKRGFWGWLRGRPDETDTAPDQAAAPEAPPSADAGADVSSADMPMAVAAPGQGESDDTASEAATHAAPSTEAAAEELPLAAAEAGNAAAPVAQDAAAPEPLRAPPTAPAVIEPRRETEATTQPAPVAEPEIQAAAPKPVAARETDVAPPEAAATTAPPAIEPPAEGAPSPEIARPVSATPALPPEENRPEAAAALEEPALLRAQVEPTAPVPAAMEPPVAAVPSPEVELPASATQAPPPEESRPEPEAAASPMEAQAALPAQAEPAATPRKGFWSRLASGLARTASSLGQGITDLVSKRKLDAETLEDLEDVLIRADLGVETAMRIVEAVGKGRHDKMISPEEVKGLIAAEVERILEPVAKPLVVDHGHRPFVVLMVGVNGSGKTTTIGKLAAQWRHEGKKVVLAAGDTFRAAAIDQLKVWGQRTGTRVIAKEPGADAAGVAHDALTEARAEGADILLIDTAGRLQNRTELMAELEKIVRVVKKLEPSAPHAVLLVLDATVGQNALSQVEAFTRIAGVTGLVMTKLDGTARGGILVAIAAKHRLPVHLIGVGEGADDLQPFTARDFARAIAGLD